MTDSVIIFSASYGRQHFFPSPPEEGASVINFAQAAAAQKCRHRLEEYAYCLLQLEAECGKFMHTRRCEESCSVEPSRQAVRKFLRETQTTLRLLFSVGENKSTLKCFGTAEYSIKELRVLIDKMQYLPSRYTHEVNDIFRDIEVCLAELRETLAPLLPLKGMHVPAPAYSW